MNNIFDSLSCKVVSLNVLVLMYWATLHMNIFFFSYNPPKLSYCMSVNLLCLYVIIIVSHTQEAIIGKYILFLYLVVSSSLFLFPCPNLRESQTNNAKYTCLSTDFCTVEMIFEVFKMNFCNFCTMYLHVANLK